MTHTRLARQLSAYLDGELTPEDAEEVRAHLTRCVSCREELARLRAVKSLLGRLPEHAAPEELLASLASRPSGAAASRLPSFGWIWRAAFRRPAAVAAAVLVMALIAVPLVRGRIERLRAAGVGADVFVREHALAAAEDPFPDRAYLGLLVGDADLALAGAPREEAKGER